MIIIGIDPGTLVTGYGVIEAQPSRSKLVDFGVIECSAKLSLPLRLERIFRGIERVIEQHHPDSFAIESAFYHKNVQSTLKLGHARGVSILAAVLREIPTAEYSPREVKKAVTGNGNADKSQVEYMVRLLLALKPDEQKLPDAYDALAIALTHASRSGSEGAKVWKDWKQFVNENPDRIKVPT